MSKLQELRKLKGLSQNDLAIVSGVKKRTIQEYELNGNGGHRSKIDGAGLDKLVPLALALGCKISDMLESDDLIEQCQKLGI